MSYEKQIQEWMRAAKKSAREVLSSKEKTRRFMKKAGIISKNGKQLAKAYR